MTEVRHRSQVPSVARNRRCAPTMHLQLRHIILPRLDVAGNLRRTVASTPASIWRRPLLPPTIVQHWPRLIRLIHFDAHTPRAQESQDHLCKGDEATRGDTARNPDEAARQ